MNNHHRTLRHLPGIAAAALMLLALIACEGGAEEPTSSLTAPTGMFSTLPTTEPPVLGDQPLSIKLNTPEPTFTLQPTFTPNPTYTPVPTPTPDPTGTPVPTLAPTGTPVPTATPNPTATPQPTVKPSPTALHFRQTRLFLFPPTPHSQLTRKNQLLLQSRRQDPASPLPFPFPRQHLRPR